MLTLIVGGSASGKSEYAEKLIMAQTGQHVYLATMEPWGDESAARVKKHRRARSGRHFLTVERCIGLDKLDLPKGASVLVEDLGNLVANELFRTDGGGEDAIFGGLIHLMESCANLSVVSNEVFTGGYTYEGETLRYLKALAGVNRWLAAYADLVIEVICGLPDIWKGALP